MAVSVGSITAEMVADVRRFVGPVRDAQRALGNFESRVTRVSRRLGDLGQRGQRVGTMLSVGVTLPLIAAGAAAVNMAASAEEAESQFNVAFGSMADESRAFVDTLAEGMDRSRFEMRAMAARTQALLGPMIGNTEAAAAFSTALTGLTQDLSSFFDVTEAEALQRVQSALVGEAEAVRRFGINMGEASLQQEALRLGIERSTTEMSEQEKVLIRLSVLFTQSEQAQGDVIRTSMSFTNQVRALRGELNDLGVEIGRALLPLASSMVGFAREAVRVFSELSPEAKQLAIQIGLVAAALGPVVLVLSTMLAVLPNVVKGVLLLGRGMKLLVNVLTKGNWIGLIITGLAALLLSFDAVRKGLNELLRDLGLGGLLDTVEELGGAFSELGKAAEGLATVDMTAVQERASQELQARIKENQQLIADMIAGGAEQGSERAAAIINDELERAFQGIGVLPASFASFEFSQAVLDALGMETFAEEFFQKQGLDKAGREAAISAIAGFQDEMSRMNVERRVLEFRGVDFPEVNLRAMEMQRDALENLLRTLSEAGLQEGRIFSAIGEQISEVSAEIKEQEAAIERLGQTSVDEGQKIIDQTRAIKDNLLFVTDGWESGLIDPALRAERAIKQAMGETFSTIDRQIEATKTALRSLFQRGMTEESAEIQQLSDLLERLLALQHKSFFDLQIEGIIAALKQFRDGIFNALTPLGIVQSVLQALAGPVRALLQPMFMLAEIIARALMPVFEALFPIIKTFAQILLTGVQVIGGVWNTLIEIVSMIPFVNLRRFKIDLEAVSEGQRALADLTWEEAQAMAGLTEQTQQATEAMRNVPAIFRIVSRRAQAIAGGGPSPVTAGAMAAGGPSPVGRGGGANVQVILQGDTFGVDDLDQRITTAAARGVRSAHLAHRGLVGAEG